MSREGVSSARRRPGAIKGIDLTGTARYLISDQYVPAFLSSKGETFEPASWQQSLLALCPREQLVAAIAAATHVAESPNELDAWSGYVLSNLEAAMADPMSAALAAPGPQTRMLARQPLLLAMRLALAAPVPASTGTADPRIVATLLTHHAAGGFLNPRPQRQSVQAAQSSPAADNAPRMAGYPEPLAMNLVANALFNTPLNFGDLIARTRLFWTTYESQLQRFKPRAPLRNMLKEATGGLDIDEMLALAFGLFAHANTTGLTNGGPLDLAGLGVSPESISIFLDLFADDAAGFTAAFAATATRSAPAAGTPVPGTVSGEWEFIPFESRPLLRTGPTEALVIDERLLQRRFTQALYWLIHDHEKAIYKEKGRNRWTQAYSELVEIHAETLARDLAPVATNGLKAFFTEEQVAKLGGANADFGIDFGDLVLIADVVQHQFVVPTRSYADPVAFAKDLKKGVEDKAEQLDKTIDLLLDRVDHPDHPLGRRPRTIVPMIVAGADFPGIPFVYQLAREQVHSAALLRQQECTKLLIITLSELEMLSALVSDGKAPRVLDVIIGYLNDTTDGSLTNYLYRHYGGGPAERTPILREALNDALADIERRLITTETP